MTFNELKYSIKKDLLSRNLSDPNIRIRAMDNLIELIKINFPDIYANPFVLKQIDKNEFKNKLAKYKTNYKLNGAEDSIINEFYYKI